MSIGDRKSQHLEICLREDVRSALTTGLERYHLLHQALPELDLARVNCSIQFLGHTLRAPLLISAMTGGTGAASRVNRRLAEVAQQLGLAMGLGSQRAGIEDADLMATYMVRDLAPDILLLANIGAVQLNNGFGRDDCLRAVEKVGADALVLHLNALQEAVQPEGNTNFGGLIARISDLCQTLPYPVIVKEVGSGLSAEAARALLNAGVSALDTGGAGGTSWSEVERHRSDTPLQAQVSAAFSSWGIPTVESLRAIRSVAPDLPLIASGGILDGVMVAKCLALGANMAGMAHALLQPATESTQAVYDKLSVVVQQLRIAMFCCGAPNVAALDVTRLTYY